MSFNTFGHCEPGNFGLNPDGRLNEQSIAAQEQFFLEEGLIHQAPPVSSFVDDTFVAAADQALGPS